jgi:DNA-binding response OmpR family regulator
MTKDKKTSIRNRVMVIETDDLIHQLIDRWLTEAGYTVAASDAAASGIALVIADVPNPAQAEPVLRELKARYDAPILAISGRFRRDLAASERAARRLDVAKVLPKPFNGEDLLAAVRKCLDGT